jgi:ABC-2 type transport system permease protein
MPVLVLLLALMAIGLAMLLSVLFVRFRDIQPIWDVVLQVAFYASPVLYVVGDLPDWIQYEMLSANPLADIFTQARYALLDPSAPTAADAIGADARLLLPLGVIAVSFALGAWAFKREAPRIAENL